MPKYRITYSDVSKKGRGRTHSIETNASSASEAETNFLKYNGEMEVISVHEIKTSAN